MQDEEVTKKLNGFVNGNLPIPPVVKNGHVSPSSPKAEARPFQRRKIAEHDVVERRFDQELCDVLKILDATQLAQDISRAANPDTVRRVCDFFAQRWKLKDDMSEICFRGMLIVLEQCLDSGQDNEYFANFVDSLGYHTVVFWKKAVPMLYESDMQYSTEYRDALLFSLTLYDVNSGRNRLRELFAAVPGLRTSLMAKNAKRFEESFHVMMQRRAHSASVCSTRSNSQRGENDQESQSMLNELAEDVKAMEVEDQQDPLDEDDYEVDRTLHANDRDYLNTIQGNGSAGAAASASGRLSPCLGAAASALRSNTPTALEMRRGSLSRLFRRQSSSGNNSDKNAATLKAMPPPVAPIVPPPLPPVAALFERQISNTSANGADGVASGNGSSSGGGSGNVTEHPDTIITGGLCSGHFQERVINVSNAPPVQLKRRRESGQWEIGQGSGGLVSCCDPVMGKDTENVWLACFGPGVPFHSPSSRSDVNSPLPPRTNSLGLPLIRNIATEVQISMLQEPSKKEDDEAAREIKDQMSLLGVLRDYNRDNYKLNPVVVDENDYNTYYGGISNGLLWPAFHTLPEYIVKDYEDPKVLRDHWNAYVRVNYQFALNAVRKSRPQDFLWIHDYHLMLTGLIIQSLDFNFEIGFFLHIPFQPPADFFSKFTIVAEAVVRGLMRFTKVGFQTHLDRQSFIIVVKERFPLAKIQYHQEIDKYVIAYEGYTTTLGVFPVSIKNEDFLNVCRRPSVQDKAANIRQKIMGKKAKDGKLFFSVERFDYTKGIKQKMAAYIKYFELYPNRIGKDVFLQVAVTNRRSVDTYREYQDECQRVVNELNAKIRCPDDADWRPCIFLTDGLTRPDLVAHYLAMDVGVVTPEKDGMNLVAKEMIVCNPNASLVISCGAGTEQQLNSAGFYSDLDKCYHRVADIHDAASFSRTLYGAAVEELGAIQEHGTRLSHFMMQNDIERWSSNFLDPSWTHDVVQVARLRTLQDFHDLLFAARNVRRVIVERVLNGHAIRPHFGISLNNVRKSLENSLDPKTKLLTLTASKGADAKVSATFDVTDEICQLSIDLDFLNYVQSEAYDNLEIFLHDLSKYHPGSLDEFAKELDSAIGLLCNADHFEYFFSDRDGTLRSYACTYASSIQGAYSGVIQATFAHRCTQYAAIVTSAPLQNVGILDVTVVPDGYYCLGASGGREWYINSSKKFKDTSISDEDLQLLEKLADKIATLLENPKFQQYTWLGSGLQRHYGHVTIARQDVYKSIDEEVSAAWYRTICELVHEMDPTGKSLHVADSETDIKIHLKARLSGKTFTKGHGIRLFAEKMKLDLKKGNILIFGDSETDLPMLKEVLMINPLNVFTIWVTKNEDLQRKVSEMCHQVHNSNFVFVSSPFVILGAMAQATIREIKIRPSKSDISATISSDLDLEE